MEDNQEFRDIIQTVTRGSYIYVKLSDGKIYRVGFPTDNVLPTEFLVRVAEVEMSLEQIIRQTSLPMDGAC